MQVPGIGTKRCHSLLHSNALKKAEQEIVKILKNKIKMVSYLHPEYPARLKSHPNSPLILYTKGDIPFNHERTVGIIGTRHPTLSGINQCESMVKQLRAYNVCVVSGLAYGIDSAAHLNAIRNEMSTIAILGSGMDHIYPQANREMTEKMMNNGGIISEFSFDTKPDRENFPKRNRIIAAMSDVLIVVQSAQKGGSMITVEYANEFSKDVFAIPGRLGEEMSKGTNHLIKTHQAHLLSSVKDIAYIARWEKETVQAKFSFLEILTQKEKEIYALIEENQEIGLDKLTILSRISISELSSILLNLEFNGMVKSIPGKKYILAAKSQ